MSVTVRKALPTDADNIFAAEQAYIDCPWSRDQIAAQIASPGAIVLVAETGGEFCGYVTCDIGYDCCEIGNIAVDGEYRRRGVGRSLLVRLMTEARSLGKESVFLQVRDGNVAAIALYTYLGFAVVGKRKNYYKDKDALIMRLNL